jgi:hypothetical protein
MKKISILIVVFFLLMTGLAMAQHQHGAQPGAEQPAPQEGAQPGAPAAACATCPQMDQGGCACMKQGQCQCMKQGACPCCGMMRGMGGMSGGCMGRGMGPGMGMMGMGGGMMGSSMMGGGMMGMGRGLGKGLGHILNPCAMLMVDPLNPAVKEHLSKPDVKAFLDATKDTRRNLLLRKFDYFEAARNPETKPEDLLKLKQEIRKLQADLFLKAPLDSMDPDGSDE